MVMLLITMKLVLFLFFLISFTIAQPPNFLDQVCDNSKGNYSTDSAYRRNLDSVLSSLATTANTSYGFYNSSSIGASQPDIVYAISLCRGDVEPVACRSCVNDSIIKLRQLCPNQKNAIGWYDNCFLRYSNATILNKMDSDYSFYLWNPSRSRKPTEYNSDLRPLLVELRGVATSGGSLKKFAIGNTTGPDFSNIYGLMQCTPDLSESQCYDCLELAINEIPKCCDGQVGGRVLKFSCNLRYEIYRFYDTQTVTAPSLSAPMPPPSTPASPLPPPQGVGGKDSNTTTIVIAVVAPTVSLVIVAVFASIFLRKRKERKPRETSEFEEMNHISTADSLQYNFSTIKAATVDFSTTNKLGEGGFGLVYKGKLQNGLEIAVKRLSRNSGQGELEFKNEVVLVARLQHRNLVRLLGFCLEGTERILIYEFMPNASLDQFIFDPIKRATLNWDRRYKIIGGIARGLLYLHEDSRLRIIHRDLKASNVLLDADMNAKIADFGMARLFTLEETHDNTSRIVGTYGYMAPEYVTHGQFSVKSDVFSFGVLLLEIVTGQKNHCFRNGEVVEDLISHAWKSWRDGTCSTIIDPILRVGSGSLRDMMRSIHIGLLCVQDNVVDRPTMASVILMLGSSSLTLPTPSEPAFFMHSSIDPEMPLLEDISRSSAFSELRGRSRSSKTLSGRRNDSTILYPR